MANYSHISSEQRDITQKLLNQNKSFTYIGKVINKDRTTISKEVKRNRYIKSYFYEPFDTKAINKESLKCNRLSKTPYVCNGCSNVKHCLKHKIYYNGIEAHKNYLKYLSESRQGVDITPDELDKIENIIVPLIKHQKHSINQVYANFSDIIPFSKTTFYDYINKGILSLDATDLPKQGKYKKRKKNIDRTYKKKSKILKGRTYDDYIDFITKHPTFNKVQMDTVHGKQTDIKTLLTILLVDTSFMLIFLLNKNNSQEVSKVFQHLKEVIPIDIYKKVFRIILTDNGNEFSNPYEMERDYLTTKKVTNVFFCHPYSPFEKAQIENNHKFIRQIFPKKKTSFDNFNTETVKRLQDNINAIPRESLDNQTPFDLTLKKFPEIIETLNCKYIEPNQVSLNPADILDE